VGDRLAGLGAICERQYVSWPGFGDQPYDPAVQGFADLAARVIDAVCGPCDLVAQSIGGLIAIRIALERPDLVRRLVLCATSAGVDLARLGGADWRDEYRAEFPDAARWVCDAAVPDHTSELALITAPTLLLWGDADPISPIAVGHHLASLLGDARLEIIPGGTHSFAHDAPATVAPLIAAHLDRPGPALQPRRQRGSDSPLP